MTSELILRDLPMPIRTPRLVIKTPAAGIGQMMYDAKIETADLLKEWFGWAHHPMSVDADETMLRKHAAKFIAREDLMMIVFDHDGRFIGSTGLHFINKFETPIMHIGYWCRSTEQGKGYVTEWVNALTRYGFDVLGLKKMSIHADSENTKSIAVPRRLSFELEYTSKGGYGQTQ